MANSWQFSNMILIHSTAFRPDILLLNRLDWPLEGHSMNSTQGPVQGSLCCNYFNQLLDMTHLPDGWGKGHVLTTTGQYESQWDDLEKKYHSILQHRGYMSK